MFPSLPHQPTTHSHGRNADASRPASTRTLRGVASKGGGKTTPGGTRLEKDLFSATWRAKA